MSKYDDIINLNCKFFYFLNKCSLVILKKYFHFVLVRFNKIYAHIYNGSKSFS